MFAAVSHGLFNGSAHHRINSEDTLTQVIALDTVELTADASPKIKHLSVAPLISNAIKRVHGKRSLRRLTAFQSDLVRERYAGQEPTDESEDEDED